MIQRYLPLPDGVKTSTVKKVQLAEETLEKATIRPEGEDYFYRLGEKGLHLNVAQVQAVQHVEGPFLTLAGAGSGKTSVLACRAGYLMTVKGVNPEQILLVTFTKKAAGEMKARMAGLPGLLSRDAHRVQASTFHSFFLTLLRAQGCRETILSREGHKQLILKRMIREKKLNEQLEPETLLALFSSHKLALKNPDDWPADTKAEREIRSLFIAYESWKRAHQQMDFDDILVKAHELLEGSPALLRKLQDRFRYIMVDEFQDTNTVQYTLIQFIAARHRNLFVVGDDDQTIYSFNGAKHHFILNFEKIYPEAETVTLGVNYRSTDAIVGLGRDIIRHNLKRRDKDLKAVKASVVAPQYARPQTTDVEADWIIEHVIEQVKSGEKAYRDIAILHRTASLARAMFEALTIAEIPFVYEAQGHQSFYDQGTVKPLIDHLRLSMNPRYEAGIEGILPTLYVNREQGMRTIHHGETGQQKKYPLIHLTQIAALKPFQVNNIKERIKTIKDLAKLSPLAAIRHMRKTFYNKFIEADESHQLTLHKETLREAMDELETSAKRFDTISGFIAFVDGMIAKHDDMKNLRQDPDADAVKLMTIHRSKGLEFPTVYLIGASEGMLPHVSALEADEMKDVRAGRDQAAEEALEEERRLTYVAVTRAKDSLYISSPAFYRGQKAAVSRFLQEAYLGKKVTSDKLEHKTFPKKETKRPQRPETVLAFICTSEQCHGWQRITTVEEAALMEKKCPMCGSLMKKGEKKLGV